MFSAVPSRIRCLLSFEAQEICGVIRQLGAASRGLSARMGSPDTTSTAAAATIKSQINSILRKFGMRRMKDVIAVLNKVDFARLVTMMQKH